jgi:hypothetical protein
MNNHLADIKLRSSTASALTNTRVSGLRFLRRYAMHHEHSRHWLRALTILLTREGRAHG